MNAVSDTSPLCYLILIEQIDILGALFDRVSIPDAVRQELASPGAPREVRNWIAEPPSWLDVRRALPAVAADLSRLEAGEREAILLAQQLSEVVVLDEKKAREAAQRRGLAVTGLLGLLVAAAEQGLLDLPDAIERLHRTNFRVDPKLLKLLLEKTRDQPPWR